MTSHMDLTYRLHHVRYSSQQPGANSGLLKQALQQEIVLQQPRRSFVGQGIDFFVEWTEPSVDQTKNGMNQITFTVNDVELAFTTLTERGLQPAWSPQMSSLGLHCGLLDDNGIVIELLDRHSDTLPKVETDGSSPFQFHHVNILTDDWHRTKHFYESHFGFQTIYEYVDDDGGAFLFLADPFFNFAEHNVLLEVTGPPYAEAREDAFYAKHGAGLDHICYVAEDVDDAFARLLQAGAEKLCEPYDAYGSRLAWVKDADGNDIELMTPIPETLFAQFLENRIG